MQIAPMNCFVILLTVFFSPQSRGPLNPVVDFASFRFGATETYTEIYYAIPTSGLSFVPTTSGKWRAEAKIRLVISQGDTIKRDESWRLEKVVDDSSQIRATGSMVDQVRYVTAPGKYQISFYVEDLRNAQNAGKVEKSLAVSDFSKTALTLSDIQFAGAVKTVAGDSSNVFYKNGVEVIPEPGAMFGQKAPMLYYYLEAYHLTAAIQGRSYKTRCQINDEQGRPVLTVKPREQSKPIMAASVEVGGLNVSALPSGVYQFRFGIFDADNKFLQAATKKFYVYNPDVTTPAPAGIAIDPGAVQRSEFAGMSEKELDADFEKAKYLVKPEEKKAYASLKNLEGKRQYLFDFWQRRDLTPETPANEFRLEYRRRGQHADEHFRSYARPGWKTDRGRVYMLYGPPNDIERFPNNPLSYSYEIWHYDNLEGGVLFVFADLQEFGEYTQLHSTKRGEPLNKEWETKIKKY